MQFTPSRENQNRKYKYYLFHPIRFTVKNFCTDLNIFPLAYACMFAYPQTHAPPDLEMHASLYVSTHLPLLNATLSVKQIHFSWQLYIKSSWYTCGINSILFTHADKMFL